MNRHMAVVVLAGALSALAAPSYAQVPNRTMSQNIVRLVLVDELSVAGMRVEIVRDEEAIDGLGMMLITNETTAEDLARAALAFIRQASEPDGEHMRSRVFIPARSGEAIRNVAFYEAQLARLHHQMPSAVQGYGMTQSIILPVRR